VADNITREMGRLGDDEATPVRIARPSLRRVSPKLEQRMAADVAETNQLASNPQAAQPVDIGEPSDNDQMPQVLRRISLQAKEQMAGDENEITGLQIVGCDSQIRRGVLRTLNTVGSLVAPRFIAYILGTEALRQIHNPQSPNG
jgi:hypothetical protein